MNERNRIISVVLSRRLTFASHQNAVPLVRDLTIRNGSADDWDDITLELTANPSFVSSRTWHLDRVAADSTAYMTDLDVSLQSQWLMDLTEAIRGELTFTLYRGSDCLETIREPIDLLARHEWGGIEHMPELLAAFSMPNDPAIERVLKNASEILRQAEKSGAIDGYTSGQPRRIWEIASAIWSAVCALELDYALPPASFEHSGQKIRLPSMILEARRATCLDITLLFTAALEQAGFNPVVVFTQGHAFAGLWLQPEAFAAVTVDAASVLRKRLALNELIVFETTLVTQRPRVRFSEAIEVATRGLAEAVEANFLLAVDLRRARMQRIMPLPILGHTGRVEAPLDQPEEVGPAPGGDALEEAPLLADFDGVAAPIERVDATPQTRFDRWQRKLLDLSLRNRLLNFRATRRAVPLLCPTPGMLEDQLSAGKHIKIVPAPTLTDADHGRSGNVHQQRTGEHLDEVYAQEALNRGEVVVQLDAQELETRLTELYRAARADMQEGGANTLFLAMGFLVWQRDPKDSRKCRAPLILVPASLERKSVRSGVQMVKHDDEPRFNTTLLEMLRQDFDLDIRGFDEGLPHDDAGIDVAAIWNRMRQEIKEIDGFEVVEDVVLSTLSFAKYLMWKDLVDRTAQLKQNAVVRHLIDTPRDPYVSDVAFPAPHRLDRDYAPQKCFTPLAADSSQLSSILACASGKDFVLIGPPGTGKSQTISNMIAHNLAEGRTVLFVSEKIAALDVVHRRLRDVGLGEFCLELHSNKAKKMDVLHQLGAAWEATATFSQSRWRREAERLKIARDRLNLMVERLHCLHPNGLTVYQAMGRLLHDTDSHRIAMSWPTPDTHDQDALDALRGIADRMAVNASEIGVETLADSAYTAIHHTDWSPIWQRHLIEQASTLANAARNAETRMRDLLQHALRLETDVRSWERLSALATLAGVLPLVYGQNLAFLFEPDASATLRELQSGIEHLKQYRQTEAGLSCPYMARAWQHVDLDALSRLWDAAHATWWPKSAWMKWRVRNALRGQGRALGKPDVEHDLAQLRTLRQLGRAIDDLSTLSDKVDVWVAFDTDAARAIERLEIAQQLRAAIAGLSADPEALAHMRAALCTLLTGGNDLLAATGTVGRSCLAFTEAWQDLQEALHRFASTAGADVRDAMSAADDDTWLAQLDHTLHEIISGEAKLNAWCSWWRVRQEAMEAGLHPLVEAFEQGQIAAGNARHVFETSYCKWWVDAVVDGDEVLRGFVSAEHENRIRNFRALDEQFTALTRDYIRARLCKNLPARDDVTRGSEFGILRRELEKKRRHKPLRQLVAEMPNALPQLTPCLLMSPLSIAQYLPPDQALFDVVIFDEASQITVWDAIGAIARGRQVVIVGDPKQLPPTNFFNRADNDADDDVNLDGDLESILDECLGASLPTMHLSWHYRSEHESLIAFSNHRYYGGGLVTFPSPLTTDRAVRYLPVPDGIYERAGSRTNRGEAEVVVREVIQRLKDPAFTAVNRSIGVVTFNTEQQRLIEDLLDEERRRDASIEPFFAEERLEPVFVKNLESVQGDERDVILFSIGYGPDRTGNITMNFGPLNREGGERRLNVAITRARSELLVCATLHPDQIDLSRTRAKGVRDLKHFLEFAERGPHALAGAVYGSTGDYESYFEKAVARALMDKGWTVHPQVGVSSFRVDLGIVHPDHPGRYLAGVECDGATYHRSATARDRDKLREQVLCRLGWDILRVWSTDWWIDRSGALDKLHSALTALLEASRARAATAPLADDGTVSHTVEARASTTYVISTPASVVAALAPERFYNADYDDTLVAMIEHVIAVEGPIRDDVLAKRIARAHAFQRTGNRIRRRIEALAAQRFETTREGDAQFFWPEHVSPESWAAFRMATSAAEARSVEEISVYELAVLARDIIKAHANVKDPAPAMAQALGLNRLNAGTRKRLEEAISLAH
jgi:very-short-patch-repair endonuclease